MDKKQEHLNNSLRHIEIADHITYVTFPLVNEKKLLLKIFDEIYHSLISIISSVLIYEYKNRKIKLYKDNLENINNFIKLSKNYDIKIEDIEKIRKILIIYQKHKMSAMEFSRKNRIIIMSDNLETIGLDINLIKEYLSLVKSLYLKVSIRINN